MRANPWICFAAAVVVGVWAMGRGIEYGDATVFVVIKGLIGAFIASFLVEVWARSSADRRTWTHVGDPKPRPHHYQTPVRTHEIRVYAGEELKAGDWARVRPEDGKIVKAAGPHDGAQFRIPHGARFNADGTVEWDA